MARAYDDVLNKDCGTRAAVLTAGQVYPIVVTARGCRDWCQSAAGAATLGVGFELTRQRQFETNRSSAGYEAMAFLRPVGALSSS